MSIVDVLVIAVFGPGVLIWLYALFATLRMVRAIPVLARVPPSNGSCTVSIISPACNEAASVGRSAQSWLDQDGVAAQVVLVNDRSTDDTARIINELAEQDQRVTAVHVTELPDGWLGKLNALHQGVQHATGDWLLFADADVRLAKDALARAIHHAEQENFDLVSAYPEIESAGFGADTVWAAIGATAGPAGLWRCRDPKSKRAFAMGAFILVRRSAFERTPGFEWLKLEVADDMGLAILMKHHGHRCDIVSGRGQVRLRWYTSLADMVRRSQKNWFAILSRFSLARATFISSLCVATALTPLALLMPASHPMLLLLPALCTLCLVGTSLGEALWSGRPALPALFAPLGMLLLAFMVMRAAIIGRRLGGIEWRGVVYPTASLRGVQRFQM